MSTKISTKPKETKATAVKATAIRLSEADKAAQDKVAADLHAAADKADAKLRKTLADIEILERKAASGCALEANQLAKVARKREILAQLGV